MSLRIVADAARLADIAAREVVAIGRDAIETTGRFLIALSGGSTPRAMHARLTAADLRTELEWDRVEFFWSDERAVPPDHPDSNYGMARTTLLEPLGIADIRVHRMRGEAPNLGRAAADYESELAKLTGARPAGPPPRLDLVLLGLGTDGHTASLFPGTAALDVDDRWVVANSVPQLATERLTFTFPMLDAARHVRLLVAGADKAEALEAVWNGPLDSRRYPAQHLRGDDLRVGWLVDRAAAAALRPDTTGTRG